MKDSEERSLSGLRTCLGKATARLGRAYFRTLRQREHVGLKAWEIPAALALTTSYYAFFACGGLLTHVSPRSMGRRFRV
jgi:hypothetical protein